MHRPGDWHWFCNVGLLVQATGTALFHGDSPRSHILHRYKVLLFIKIRRATKLSEQSMIVKSTATGPPWQVCVTSAPSCLLCPSTGSISLQRQYDPYATVTACYTSRQDCAPLLKSSSPPRNLLQYRAMIWQLHVCLQIWQHLTTGLLPPMISSITLVLGVSKTNAYDNSLTDDTEKQIT